MAGAERAGGEQKGRSAGRTEMGGREEAWWTGSIPERERVHGGDDEQNASQTSARVAHPKATRTLVCSKNRGTGRRLKREP